MDYPTFTIPGDEDALARSEMLQQAALFGRLPPRRSAVMSCRVPACSFVPAEGSVFCSTHRMQGLLGPDRMQGLFGLGRGGAP